MCPHQTLVGRDGSPDAHWVVEATFLVPCMFNVEEPGLSVFYCSMWNVPTIHLVGVGWVGGEGGSPDIYWVVEATNCECSLCPNPPQVG